jgi:hypothetical protein
MNTKPNLPEEIGLGKITMSWRGSLNRGGAVWMFLVYLTDVPGAYLLRHHEGWPLAIKVAVVLIPIIASLLYLRGMVCWIRGMDELHQRLVLGSFLFATTAYVFLTITWPLLDRAGLFAALHWTKFHLDRMPFSNCTFAICLTYILAGAGYARLNRRYR